MGSVRIALVQYESTLNQPAHNAERACAFIQEAAENGAKIVCFPELFSTGYNLELVGPQLPHTGETLTGPTISLLRQAAAKNHCYVIAPIALEREIPGVLYNSAVLIDDDGQVVGVYDKHHLWALERFYFSSGNEIPVFETKYGRIGIMICYDAGFPETARILALQGAEIIFMPSAWRVQDWDMWNLNIPQRGLENSLYIAAVNRYGHEGELYMYGDSKVADWRGRIIAQSTGEQEEIVYANLDLEELRQARMDIPYLKDRRPESYDLLSK